MSWPLRQSTASQYIPLGPFVDSTDGNTAETALTIANTDIKLQKYGATAEVNKNVGGATHLANGRYYTVLDATDSNTLGPMRVSVHVAGALSVWLDACVYSSAKYDAEYLGIGFVNANIAGIKDNAQTAQNYTTTSLTLVNGTTSSPGDFITIDSAGQGAGPTHQITSINPTVPTAKVATIDPAFSPTLTGTVVYTTRIGARTPETLPDVNVTEVSGTPQTARDLGITVADLLVALKADAEWKTILANVNGQWSISEPGSYPGNVVLSLLDKTGGVVRATLTLNCTSRPSVLSRVST